MIIRADAAALCRYLAAQPFMTNSSHCYRRGTSAAANSAPPMYGGYFSLFFFLSKCAALTSTAFGGHVAVIMYPTQSILHSTRNTADMDLGSRALVATG